MSYHAAVNGRDEPGHHGGEAIAPTTHLAHSARMRGGWVYIVTNRPNGTLYLGVTANLGRRAWEHRTGAIEGFTKRYGLGRLVWSEHHDDIRMAIQRERTMKHWPRAWKVRLVLALNPDWRDMFYELNM